VHYGALRMAAMKYFTKRNKVAESRKKPTAAGLMVTIIGGIAC
jgi:hypothetical protein